MSTHDAPIDRYVDDGVDFASWADALRDGVLLGQECTDCGRLMTTPKAGCLRCTGRDLAPRVLPTTGRVYSVSHVSVPPAGFDGGYTIGLVELSGGGGARILGRLPGDAEIGDGVSLDGVIEVTDSPSPVFR